jgi:hypothetical protein
MEDSFFWSQLPLNKAVGPKLLSRCPSLVIASLKATKFTCANGTAVYHTSPGGISVAQCPATLWNYRNDEKKIRSRMHM